MVKDLAAALVSLREKIRKLGSRWEAKPCAEDE